LNINNGVLFVGNGINLTFENKSEIIIPEKENWDFTGMSWENIIRQIIFNYGNLVEYEKIIEFPMTMQIVAATRDSVDKALKSISKSFSSEIIGNDKKEFCKKILSVPLSDIITTNYSYELEQAAGITPCKNAYYRARDYSKKPLTKSEDLTRLYTYSDLTSYKKKVWHIHGDASSPKSVTMGHYWYGKLLKNIESRAADFIRVYRIGESKNTDVPCMSWVDAFLAKDVYMVGFGFDISELDLWWLACCKKRNFSATKIYFYTHKKNDEIRLKALFDSYGIEICNHIKLVNENYLKFYEEVIKDITGKIEEKRK